MEEIPDVQTLVDAMAEAIAKELPPKLLNALTSLAWIADDFDEKVVATLLGLGEGDRKYWGQFLNVMRNSGVLRMGWDRTWEMSFPIAVGMKRRLFRLAGLEGVEEVLKELRRVLRDLRSQYPLTRPFYENIDKNLVDQYAAARMCFDDFEEALKVKL